MKPIATGLWEYSTPVKLAGISMPARTVVIELSGGGVAIHSPGAFDLEARAAIEVVGEVRALIAPNRFHHLFLSDWRRAYPEAEVYVAPELPQKRRDLKDVELLTQSPPLLWSADLEQHVWGGLPTLGEVVFVHRASRTLINTDMMHNMHHEPQRLARTAWRLLGAYQRFGTSRLERWLTKDKHALRSSVEHVLSWDFDRVTVAHGDILETGGKDQVRRAWAWV